MMLRIRPHPSWCSNRLLFGTRWWAMTLNPGLYPRDTRARTSVSLKKTASKAGILSGANSRRCFHSSPIRQTEIQLVTVPPMAESISEGVLSTFTRKPGEYTEQNEEIASIETDKIDVSVNASQGGILVRHLVEEGDTVTVGQPIAELKPADRSVSDSSSQDKISEGTGSSTPVKHNESSSPAPETEASAADRPESSKPPSTTQTQPAQTHSRVDPVHRSSRLETKVKMTRMRMRTAERLKESQNRTAFLTTFNEVDMSRVMDFRARYKDDILRRHGVKLGFMGPVTRASVLALGQIPGINAAIENEDTVVYRDYVDLSVAVATPKGLVTPVLRNVEAKSVLEIERGIAELGKKGREGKLTMEDMNGGTFTISNSGIWGSLFGTPIINTPQTAVLGIYGIQQRPIAVNGQLEIRPIMYTALTYDHRLVDGREAVKFLTMIKNYLEDPEGMLIV